MLKSDNAEMNVETTGKELSYTSSKVCESSGQRKNLCGEEAPRICISIKFPRNAPGLLTENRQLKERSREKSGRQTDGQTDSEMKKPRCVLPTFIHTQMQRERERDLEKQAQTVKSTHRHALRQRN